MPWASSEGVRAGRSSATSAGTIAWKKRRKRKPSSPIHTKQKMTIESKALVMSKASVQPFACAAMMLSAAANPTADEQDETANPKGTTASAPVGLRAAMLARTENMSA